ncbi:MAG: HAD family hydrolase [Planctomycetota bacterium]
MSSIADILSRTEVISFDCYSTLIDWSAGIEQALGTMFGTAIGEPMGAVVRAYLETEVAVKSEGYRPCRDVMAETVVRLARRLDVRLCTQRAGLLATRVGSVRPPLSPSQICSRRPRERAVA